MEHPILKLLQKPSRIVLGFMSGTSADGVDAAALGGVGVAVAAEAVQASPSEAPATWGCTVGDDGSVEVIYTDRIYYINFVMQFRYGAGSEYKRFRLVVTRNGILSIEEMN